MFKSVLDKDTDPSVPCPAAVVMIEKHVTISTVHVCRDVMGALKEKSV